MHQNKKQLLEISIVAFFYVTIRVTFSSDSFITMFSTSAGISKRSYLQNKMLKSRQIRWKHDAFKLAAIFFTPL